MPYIDKAHRRLIDMPLDEFIVKFRELVRSGSIAADKLDGVLNYSITKLLRQVYMPISYAKINRVIGLQKCRRLRDQTRPGRVRRIAFPDEVSLVAWH